MMDIKICKISSHYFTKILSILRYRRYQPIPTSGSNLLNGPPTQSVLYCGHNIISYLQNNVCTNIWDQKRTAGLDCQVMSISYVIIQMSYRRLMELTLECKFFFFFFWCVFFPMTYFYHDSSNISHF